MVVKIVIEVDNHYHEILSTIDELLVFLNAKIRSGSYYRLELVDKNEVGEEV